MRYIGYGETVVATDPRVADLVLEYARVLARANSADTVTIPGRIGDGDVETVSMLIGPASQLTSWSDHEPFGADVDEAVGELERRIRTSSATIAASDEPSLGGLDDFDELG